MNERTCEWCRWFVRHHSSDDSRRHLLPGQCRRYPPVLDNDDGFPGVSEQEFCGEWADRRLTAEQAERQDLVRQFALAIVQGVYADPRDVSIRPETAAAQAQTFAIALQEFIQEGQK